MVKKSERRLLPYRQSLAGTLLAAREAVMDPIRPALRAAGVTEQQWRVLRVLCEMADVDAAQLAQAALLHPPSVTRILRDLIDRRLVNRATDLQDARRAIISITPLGRDLVETTAAHTLDVLAEFGDRFGKDRLDALRRELAALSRRLAIEDRVRCVV